MRVLNWEKWMMSRNWEQGETMKGRMDIATGGNGCPKVLWRRVYGPEWELKKFHYSWSTVWRAGLGRESVILGSVGHFKYHDLYPNIAAAAKSLQSCPTLCNPIDGGPPGTPVPGILQASTLEWVAISFSNTWKWKVKVKTLSDPMDCSLPGSFLLISLGSH